MKMVLTWMGAGLILCGLGTYQTEAASQPGTVVAWGDNSFGQLNIPTNLNHVVNIAGVGSQNLALRDDGTVLAWGDNRFGQTNLPTGLSDVKAIAAGFFHCMALRRDGTVVAWGGDYYGQTNVPSGLTDVVAIAAGGSHSLALRSDGTVLAWGYNDYSQTNVPPGVSNVIGIAGGGSHSLALLNNGTVAAWGDNSLGQCDVPLNLSNAVAIAAGNSHSLALLRGGTVVSWGDNQSGQTNVPSGLGNVVAIAGGGSHSLALRSDGAVVAWGANSAGQTNVPIGLTNALAVAGGFLHSLALNLGPVILEYPPSPVSLSAGGSTNLNVAGEFGTSFDCQWSLNGQAIAGATLTSLQISNFDFAKAGVYTATVSNQDGSASASSVLRLIDSPVVLVDDIDVGGGTVHRIDSARVTLSSDFGTNANLYYTLDGSTPDFASTAYTGVLTLTNSTLIRSIAYSPLFTDSAEAAAIYIQISPTFPLTTSSPGGGTIGVSPPAYSQGDRYITNTAVTLTATPSNGWFFLGWTGDSVGTSNVTTVLMNSPHSVQAVFGTSVNLFSNGNGKVAIYPPVGPYAFGSPFRVTALPGQGSYFFGWAGSASGSVNPLVLNITNTTDLTGLFGVLKSNQVPLTIIPIGNGAVDVSPVHNVYTNGELVSLNALPGSNFVFRGWSGGASGDSNPLVLTMDAPKLVWASFYPVAASNTPSPDFLNVAITGATIGLSWNAAFGLAYQLQYATNLPQTDWSNLNDPVTSFGPSASGIDVVGPDRQRFYRVLQLR